MAELADAPDLGSGGHSRGGSNPFIRTIFISRTANRGGLFDAWPERALSFFIFGKVFRHAVFAREIFCIQALKFAEKPAVFAGLNIPSASDLCYTVFNIIRIFSASPSPGLKSVF